MQNIKWLKTEEKKKDSQTDSVVLISIWQYLVTWTDFYWVHNERKKSLST